MEKSDAYILLSQSFRILDLVLPVLYMYVPYAVRLRLELLLPLQEERGRNDDEDRTVVVLLRRLVEDHGRDHLHRLAEAHVVGEDAALVRGLALLVHHPADADNLVREEANLHAREVVAQAGGGSQMGLSKQIDYVM